MSAQGIQGFSGVQAAAAGSGGASGSQGQTAALRIVLSAVEVAKTAAAHAIAGRGGSVNLQV